MKNTKYSIGGSFPFDIIEVKWGFLDNYVIAEVERLDLLISYYTAKLTSSNADLRKTLRRKIKKTKKAKELKMDQNAEYFI